VTKGFVTQRIADSMGTRMLTKILFNSKSHTENSGEARGSCTHNEFASQLRNMDGGNLGVLQ
jgi:hypothetical protein